MAQSNTFIRLQQFSWFRDQKKMRANSKWVPFEGIASDKPKVSVDSVLEVIRDAEARPEVMAAYGSAGLNETIPDFEATLILYFEEYLQEKYGTATQDPANEIALAMRMLANGEFESAGDPKLREYLLSRSNRIFSSN